MNNKIKYLSVRFGNEISFAEIPLLRGAILNAIGEDVELLFHNHTIDGFRYSYPLIQYKRIHKKAAIICVNQGVESIAQLFSNTDFSIQLGERPVILRIEKVIPKQFVIQVWDTLFKYRIRNWLALNSENYQKYAEIESFSERILFLEKVLIGNFLSFAKGLGIEVDKEIICKIINMEEPNLIVAKGVKMMAFDVIFKTNMSLPNYIGLGKHVSIGYGIVTRLYEKDNKDE